MCSFPGTRSPEAIGCLKMNTLRPRRAGLGVGWLAGEGGIEVVQGVGEAYAEGGRGRREGKGAPLGSPEVGMGLGGEGVRRGGREGGRCSQLRRPAAPGCHRRFGATIIAHTELRMAPPVTTRGNRTPWSEKAAPGSTRIAPKWGGNGVGDEGFGGRTRAGHAMRWLGAWLWDWRWGCVPWLRPSSSSFSTLTKSWPQSRRQLLET